MIRTWFLAITACMAIISCSSIKMPEVKNYQLMGINTAKSGTGSKRPSVLVTQPTAASAFQTSKMRYIDKPYKIASFANNAWVSPPADMLYPLIIQSLQNTRHFGAVEGVPFTGTTDYHMDVKVLKLVQNFIKKPSQVELVVIATVSNDKHRITASKTFYQHVNTSQTTPYGGVMAANIATANLMRDLAVFATQATA